MQNRNHFIPAGRSFFSTLRRNVFQFLANDQDIDPFLEEFGRLYEEARRWFHAKTENASQEKFLKRVSGLICGNYIHHPNADFIKTDDGRVVAIEHCSSGQQEVLPLVTALWLIARQISATKRITLFVEEPEAHLYPTAQRDIVHLFAAALDLSSTDSTSQYVI